MLDQLALQIPNYQIIRGASPVAHWSGYMEKLGFDLKHRYGLKSTDLGFSVFSSLATSTNLFLIPDSVKLIQIVNFASIMPLQFGFSKS